MLVNYFIHSVGLILLRTTASKGSIASCYTLRLLILRVDAPAGQLQGTDHGVGELTQQLWALRCSTEVSTRNTLATVIVECDATRNKVLALLQNAGCSIQSADEIPSAPYEELREEERANKWRQLNRWAYPYDGTSAAEGKRHEFDITNQKPASRSTEQLPSPVAVEYEARVEAFIAELRQIVSGKHLDPENFDALLAEARSIVASEDPDLGPHHGLIISLETVLLARKAMQPVPQQTMVSA
jgi:hypothetical protein